MLNVNDLNQIYLGCQGENLARTIVIDVKPWLVAHPNGVISLYHKRNGSEEATATGAEFDAEAGMLTWRPTSTDTYMFGEGEAEIRLAEGSVIKKSRKIKTDVAKAVTGGDGTALESGWQGYIDAIQKAAGVAITKNGQIKFAVNSNGHLIFSYTEQVPVPADDDDTETTVGDITWIDKDLGTVSAFGVARENGWTGTEAMWTALQAACPELALKAESFGAGTRNGEDVVEGDPAYNNNAKYYAGQAAGSATSAGQSATEAAGSATAAAASAEDAAQYTHDAVSDWLDNKFGQITADPPLDRTLSQPLAAAPADMVGDLKSAFIDFTQNMLPMFFVPNSYVKKTGEIANYNNWTRTDYTYVADCASIIAKSSEQSDYNCFYDANKNFISYFAINTTSTEITVPDNAIYAIMSNTNTGMENLSVTCVKKVDVDVSDLKDKVYNNIGADRAVIAEAENIDTNKVVGSVSYSNNIITGTSGNAPWYSTHVDVTPGETYRVKVKHYITWKSGYYVIISDNSGNILVGGLQNPDGDSNAVTGIFTIPSGGTKLYISSYESGAWGDNEEITKVTYFSHLTAINNLLGDVKTVDNLIAKYHPIIPSYYDTHLANKIADINSKTANCLHGDQFIFITDYHDKKNTGFSPLLIKKIMEETGCRMVVSSGDELDVYDTKAEAEIALAKYNGLFPVPTYKVIGNHEYNDPNGTVSSKRLDHATVYGLVYRKSEGDVIHNLGTAFYFTNETQKIRYFGLGCNYASSVSYDDVQWIGDKLLESNGYKILIFSHVGLKNNSGNITVGPVIGTLCQILKAFRNHTSYSDANVSVDYSTLGSQTVLGVLSGHEHLDGEMVATGVMVIATTCDAWRGETGGLSRTPGTITEQAFDVVSLDATNLILYLTRIGAGYNRIYHVSILVVSTAETLTSQLSGTLTWNSSNINKATVDNGVIAPVSAGSCYIKATDATGNSEVWNITVI